MTVLPRQLDGTTLVPCDGCGHYLHADTAHVVHDPGCRFMDGLCQCDAGLAGWVVCAVCCPQCNGGAA